MPPIESNQNHNDNPERSRYEARETAAGQERAPQAFDDEVVGMQREIFDRTQDLQRQVLQSGGRTEQAKEIERALDNAVSQLDRFAVQKADERYIVRVPRGKHEPTLRQRLSERNLGDLNTVLDQRGFSEGARLDIVHRLEAKGYLKLTSAQDTAVAAEQRKGILSDYYYLPPRERSAFAKAGGRQKETSE